VKGAYGETLQSDEGDALNAAYTSKEEAVGKSKSFSKASQNREEGGGGEKKLSKTWGGNSGKCCLLFWGGDQTQAHRSLKF